MSKTATKRKTYDLPVEFGSSIGLGEGVARIGAKVDRAELSLDDADALFANSQLACNIAYGRSAKDVPGQQVVFDASTTIEATVDVKGFRVTAEAFTCSLSMNKGTIEVAKLSEFAGRKGKLRCSILGPAGSHADAAVDDGGEGEE